MSCLTKFRRPNCRLLNTPILGHNSPHITPETVRVVTVAVPAPEVEALASAPQRTALRQGVL